MNKILLGVNIDHVATLRNARGTYYPDPVMAADRAEKAGADGITLHLREDRRHIKEEDVLAIKPRLKTRMNLESAVTPEMIDFALRVKPHSVCFVPERREELTTEGGLDVVRYFKSVQEATEKLTKAGIIVSLFIDAKEEQIKAAVACKAPFIELHTGAYADAVREKDKQVELERIKTYAKLATDLGLLVNAGHGLNYVNVKPIAAIPEIIELNIGHAIVAQAIFSGWEKAIIDMKQLMKKARNS